MIVGSATRPLAFERSPLATSPVERSTGGTPGERVAEAVELLPRRPKNDVPPLKLMGSPEEPKPGDLPRRNAEANREMQTEPARSADPMALTADEQREVRELQARDREVRAHEAAHSSAGGALAGAPSYTYYRGPDGKLYAVGGEVSIDMSGGRTPEETIRRARQIRAAATAPASPSGQDLRVAARAAAMEMAAMMELARRRSMQVAAPTGDEPAGEELPLASSVDGLGISIASLERGSGGRYESLQSAGALTTARDLLASTWSAPSVEHMHSDSCGFCSRAVGMYRGA